MHHSKIARLISVFSGFALMGMAGSAHAVIKVTEVAKYLGNAAWKIEGAANGTFYFENGKTGGKVGFSSAIDMDGKDWIYNNGVDKTDGGNHEWRGFPNMGPDAFCHPQRGSGSTSSWVGGKMEGNSLIMEVSNASFKVHFYFFKTHIAIKMLEAKKPYAFLFEGPIGGKSEPGKDWMVAQADSVQRTVAAGSNCFLDPIYKGHKMGTFFYLGDDVAKQVWFVSKSPLTPQKDEAYVQATNMTVISFGRERVGSVDQQTLTGLDNYCTFGFLDKALGKPALIDYIESTQVTPFAAVGPGGSTHSFGSQGQSQGLLTWSETPNGLQISRSAQGPYNLRIFEVSGGRIFSKESLQGASYTVPGLRSGPYILQVQEGSHSEVRKIYKQ